MCFDSGGMQLCDSLGLNAGQENFKLKTLRKLGVASLVGILFAGSLWAQKKYDTGASDSEIKIGNVSPYSGVFQEYGAVGRAEAAYFQMINDQGGVNGRKIVFLSEDGGTGKSADLTRKLVEQDGVLLMFSSFGTEPNLAVRGYLNDKKVPQLFVQSSSSVFDDAAHFPWSMGFFATFHMEGEVYAKWILHYHPDAKIAVLQADDDAGREYLAGIHDGLGAQAATMIVKEASYSDSDASVDGQIAELKQSGADVFLNMSVGQIRYPGDSRRIYFRVAPSGIYSECFPFRRGVSGTGGFAGGRRNHLQRAVQGLAEAGNAARSGGARVYRLDEQI